MFTSRNQCSLILVFYKFNIFFINIAFNNIIRINNNFFYLLLVKIYISILLINFTYAFIDWISLRIPHALTILPNRQVCIADRENLRIVCLDVISSGLNRNPESPYSIRHRQFGRIFGIASYRK